MSTKTLPLIRWRSTILIMKRILQSHHPIRHVKSFKYAFEGLFHALLNEANFRVQVSLTIIIVSMAIYFNISYVEWGLLIMASGFLLAAEMLNTVVEELLDHLIKEYHEGVKVIKDLAAGFVLTASITALIIFILVFGHRIFGLFL